MEIADETDARYPRSPEECTLIAWAMVGNYHRRPGMYAVDYRARLFDAPLDPSIPLHRLMRERTLDAWGRLQA